MATQTIEFDAVPEAPVFDAVPDAPAFDAVPDEAVVQDAARATQQAISAVDLMRAPQQLDWSEVNEQLDTQRFIEARDIDAAAAEKFRLGEISEPELMGAYRESDRIRSQMVPTTTAGAAQAERARVAAQPEPQVTPSEAIAGFLGPGLAATAQPTIDAAGRHLGSATGGALGAGIATVATVGTGGFAPLLLGIGSSILGSYAGGAAQEKILESTETEEETLQRRQRAAEAAAQYPGANLAGGLLATRPFFGPSIAQFGRAAAGDKGALMNIGLGGSIGAGMEIVGAAMRGETAKAKDIAAAFFSNAVMNEPTKLGRKLGLRPSTEQQAVEDAQAKYAELAPDAGIAAAVGRVGEAGLENRGTTSTADVFANVPRRTSTGEPNAQQISETGAPDGGVRPPEVASADALVPTPEGGEGVQPSGQGEPLAQAAPETPREVTSIQNAVTAEERAARGIDPVEEPARRAFGEVWDTVKAEIAERPTSPDVLLAELRKKSRALTDREDALILHRQIELQKSFDTAAAEVNRAAEAGDEPARVEAMAQLDRTREALQDVYDIGKQAGTETARGLQARKMMADQEFTLAAMETRLRAEQGGALSPEQQAKVKEQADTIAKTQAEMDRILAEREVAKAEAAEDAKIDPKVKSLADRIIARLDLTAKNAATSLRSRLNNLGSAPDPLIIVDVAKIAAAKTAKGAIEFAQWSAEMVKEFGEKIRPFLQAGWDQREQHIDTEVGSAVGGKQKERSTVDKEAAAVKARLTALANRTAKLRERTATGDFSPMRKPPLDLSKNPEWVKLKAENDAAKAAYEKSRYEARKAQRSTQQKITDTVADVWAASRPILASTDISAPGRQGIFFTLPDLFMNPVRLGRQLKAMFRSQFNESKFQQNEAAIKSRENADLYESSDLYLADIDHKPSAREEQFKSELAEKIPGIGRVVRGSSRGFSAFMNTVRADAMDAFVKWSGGRENVTPETAKYLAAAINDLTGRGNVTSRQTQGALEWLAKYLFSPRLWVSRLNTAIARPIWRGLQNRQISPRARAIVAVQYLKFAGALLALKWLAGLNGGKMEEDPRDSDFGKLQFGSKRYDVMGGIGNMTTLLARLGLGKTKDDKGKVLSIAWRGEKRPDREMGQILFNHLRNKAAPIPGAVYDYFYGRHPDRSKVTPTSMVKQTVVPITVSDTVEYFRKDNPASALRDTLINALGVSVQDYQ